MRVTDERLAWVEAAVAGCRPIALRHFRAKGLRVRRKADGSPVTVADRLIEERLRRAISRAFPGEAVVGEELGGDIGGHSSFWSIDPIDGTRAFSRGLPSWGILVGRVEAGRAILGLCDFPAIGVTIGTAARMRAYERTRSGMRWLGRARPVAALRETVIFHGGARWWASSRFASGFLRLVRSCYLERAFGDCYGYLWALRGHADAVVDMAVKPWDLVPLAALAQATGRVLTDCSGIPSWSGPGSIFAHPTLARRIARMLATPGSPES